jgi:hypothetical protein
MKLEEILVEAGDMEKTYTASAYLDLDKMEFNNPAHVDLMKKIKANATEIQLTATFRFTESDLKVENKKELFNALGGKTDEDLEAERIEAERLAELEAEDFELTDE